MCLLCLSLCSKTLSTKLNRERKKLVSTKVYFLSAFFFKLKLCIIFIFMFTLKLVTCLNNVEYKYYIHRRFVDSVLILILYSQRILPIVQKSFKMQYSSFSWLTLTFAICIDCVVLCTILHGMGRVG